MRESFSRKDVAQLGLSFPNEQDATFQALESFRPPDSEQTAEIPVKAIEGKGPRWWNPAA